MTLLMVFSVLLTGRITDWDHYTHFGGVSDILLEGDGVIAATTGGLAFGTLGDGEVSWDSSWTCPGDLSLSDARCLARDDSGNLWIGTKGGGIDVSLAGGGFQHYGQLEGLPLSLEVSCILPDTTIWVGTSEGLCSKELGYFSIWTTFSTGGGLPSDIINCMASADSGLFVGTTGGLVMLRTGQPPQLSSSWLEFHALDNLIIQDVLVAGDTAWAATSGGLFIMTDGASWKEVIDFPGQSPISMDYQDGRLAIGGKGSVSVYEDSTWTIGTAGLGSQVIQDIVWVSQGLLAIGQHDDYSVDRACGNGVGVGYPGSWRSSRFYGAPSNDLRSLAVDSRNDVWVTTNRRGAAVLADNAWTEFLSELPNTNQLFSCIADGDGGVFLAPWHFGVTWIDWRGTPDRSDDGVVQFNTSNSDILNDQVRDMSISPGGGIWFAQEPYWQTPSEPSGISRLDWEPGQPETATWKTFQPSQGLPSGYCRSVEVSSHSERAWMGTQEGLVLGDIQTGQVVRTYSSESGLPSNDIQSIALSRDGRLFVGTTAGLAMIDLGSGSLSEVSLVEGSVTMLCFDNLAALWVASGSGLQRIYSDGTVEEYNTLNSPLQSLDIRYADVDMDNGLLYLATDHGLWKLRLEQGMSGELQEATVYPNPLLPGDGQVMGVAGLPDEPFDIRVFDLSGALVYESLSQRRDDFAWDGVDLEGGAVSSGSYIVRITQGGADRFVKLAVVR